MSIMFFFFIFVLKVNHLTFSDAYNSVNVSLYVPEDDFVSSLLKLKIF